MKTETVAKKRKLIVKSTLLKRKGWTEKTIRDFYPEPAEYGVNPYNWNVPAKKYDLAEVERIESTPEFQEYAQKRIIQSETAKKRCASESKEQKEKRKAAFNKQCEERSALAISYVEKAEIKVNVLPVNEIVMNAWNRYVGERKAQGMKPLPAVFYKPYIFDEIYLVRDIILRYIQNELTNFNSIVSEIRKYKYTKIAIERLTGRVWEQVYILYKGCFHDEEYVERELCVPLIKFVKKQLGIK